LSDQHDEGHTARATASLPALEIEIVHRRSPAGDADQISITLQAMPSFEAFGRFLETASPFAFWAQAARMAWLPWIEAARAAMLPSSGAPAPARLGRGGKNETPPQAGGSGEAMSE
jgi:hypothetical protein